MTGDGATAGDRTWFLLLLEYERLQHSIGRFDGHRSTVRAWLVSAVTAVLILGFQQRSVAMSVGALVVVLLFGLLEIIYMTLEVAAIKRSNHVERLLEQLRCDPSASLEGYTFGIGIVFTEHKFRLTEAIRLARHRQHITYFYASVIAVTCIAVLIGMLRF